MKVSKHVLYANTTALILNGVVVWLISVKTFPLTLGITLFLVILGGLVYFSCWVNGAVPRKPKAQPAPHEATTEPIERVVLP